MLAQVTEQPRENRPQRDYYEHRVDGFQAPSLAASRPEASFATADGDRGASVVLAERP
jgi:hypothetical protein